MQSLLLVNNLEDKADDERGNTQACQHHQWGGVVEFGSIGNSLVGHGEDLADEQGEQPQADILYPEDKGVGRADDLGVYQLGHAWPQRGGDKRERCAENEDGHVGYDDSAYLVALEFGKNEGEGKVAVNPERA